MWTNRSVNVEAALSVSGVSVELIDFRWNENEGGDSLSFDAGRHMIARLIAPANLVSYLRVADYDFVRRERVLFLPAGMSVISRGARGGHAKFGVCFFSQERFDSLIGHDRQWDIMDCGDVKCPPLDRVMQRLIEEVTFPGLASDVLVDALSLQAMVELSRCLDDRRKKNSRQPGSLTPWHMRRLTDYVESHSGGPILVADLASLCGLSSGHLHRAFKQTTGRTVHDYVEDVRLTRAKSLLTTGSMPLKQIAGLLGFKNASGFTMAFQRKVGETPSAFRRRAAASGYHDVYGQ
jgi:AraC family transcriptional regulator